MDDIEGYTEDTKEFEKKMKDARKKFREEERKMAIRSMEALLQVSDKYSKFCKQKMDKLKTKVVQDNNNEIEEKKLDTNLSLKYFKNGKLHEYQVEGVSWLVMLFNYGLNGILADEMGLGKTVQIIAFICHLIEKNAKGPFLIVVPLSTLPNWKSEFARFAPDIPVVVLYGDQATRNTIKPSAKKIKMIDGIQARPVVIVTYQGVSQEKSFLAQMSFKYIIIDEGQRIKNHTSKLAEDLRSIPCTNKLLLTGTPLQNNITELWSLLNFLMPKLFNKVDTFQALLALEDMDDDNKIVEQEKSNSVISSIHKVLQPFMLRRLKKDVLINMVPKKEVIVYCPLSSLQLELYNFSLDMTLKTQQDNNPYTQLELDVPDITGPRKKRRCVSKNEVALEERVDDTPIGEFKRKHKLLTGETLDYDKANFYFNLYKRNYWMQLKEISNHPYLIHHPEDPPGSGLLMFGEDLIKASGKMLVLDKLLSKLKQRGHKVLIFSTFVIMLNLLEDYLHYRNYRYCRLDGSVSLDDREKSIKDFNEDKDVFLFLISTRAGGLGLNLTAADTVIFLDKDWNPQVDNQAQDRCHRIGQTKPVVIYSLTSKGTIDEKILKSGHMKKRLEKLVIREGKFVFSKLFEDMDISIQELQQMLKDTNLEQIYTDCLSDETIEKLLDRSELIDMMKK